MTKSARIQEKIVDFLADSCPHTVQEIKSFLEQVGISDYSEGQFSGSINTLLRNKSIKKMDRGIYVINQNQGGISFMKTCFVVSPIGDVGSETRINADKLFKYIISPVCESCGFEAVRVDQINDSDSITQTIIDKLLSSELVIADISGHNPNVFYELGIRHAIRSGTILIREKVNFSIPFDISHLRHIEYTQEPSGMDKLANELKRRLAFYDKNPNKPDNQFLELCSFTNYQPISYAPPAQSKEDIIGNLFGMFLTNPKLIQAVTDEQISSEEQNKLIFEELGKDPETSKNLISALYKSGLLD